MHRQSGFRQSITDVTSSRSESSASTRLEKGRKQLVPGPASWLSTLLDTFARDAVPDTRGH